MLPRVLEPEVMDTPEEARAYDLMDHTEVNRVFVDDLLAFAGGCSGEALDVGAGTGQIPVELCRRSEAFRVLAIDLSASMLDRARAKIEVAGLTGRIRTDLVDAKRLPYADGRFAAVISNSIVHHIPQPQSVVSEAWRVLAPGGAAFFRDLLRPDDERQLAHLVDAYAAGATDHQRQLFRDSLRAALRLEEVRALVAALGLPQECVQQTSDRHWTWQAIMPA
jgi:ubiquinone/menaquinone biosynthesis C-methylase UbiE